MKKSKHVSYYLKQIAKELEANKNKDIKTYGLTSQQFSIMMYLNDYINEDINQKDIEKEFMLTSPTVSGLLQRLEAKEYIQRTVSSKDSRYKVIVPTVKGLEFKDAILKRIDETEGKLMKGISLEEQESFMKIVLKIHNNIKEN